MKAYPHYPTRRQPDLNGTCEFTFLEQVEDPNQLDISSLTFPEKMIIPGCYDAMPRWAGKRGTGVYRKVFESTPGKKGILKVHGLGMWNKLYLDGHPIGIVDLPYGGMSFEVPASDQARRELVIVNDNRFDEKRMPMQHQFYDFYAYGGVYRELEFFEVEDAYLDRAAFVTENLENKEGTFTLHFGGDVPEKAECTLEIKDVDLQVTTSLSLQDKKASFPVQLADLDIWDPDNPALYEARITVDFGNGIKDTIIERIALRTVALADNAILLNGKPMKLKGYNRHEAHPQTGPALNPQMMFQDIALLKGSNCNFVRGCHYPQDQRFLDLCDEAGLLVWEETLGWGNMEEQLEDEAFLDAQHRQAKDMLYNSINHPSIIMWGFLNEAKTILEITDSIFEDLFALFRERDPSRLVTYATNRSDKCRHFAKADIISINIYPGWYGGNEEHSPLDAVEPRIDKFIQFMDENGLGNKPLIISEIGGGALYGFRDPHRAHWSEEYQSALLAEIIRVFKAKDKITGLALWQFCDCRTYNNKIALKRPRGFNNKGSYDEYRRPKMAAQVVAEAFGAD